MKHFARSRRLALGTFIVDGSGKILGFDRDIEALTGWPAVDIVGHNKELAHSLAPGEPRKGRVLATPPLYEGDLPLADRTATELKLNCRDGRQLQVDVTLERLPGTSERAVVTIRQVLARSSTREDGAGENGYDRLTGLADREAFAARVATEFAGAVASARPLAVILADVDHLRDINDRMGHGAGDEVLCKLAGILRATIEDEHHVARLGDDEFAVLLPGAGRGDARQVAARLRSAAAQYEFFTASDRVPPVTLSLGAASFPADADCESELMKRAREALEEARSMGRNRVWCYVRRPRVPLRVPVFFDGADPLPVGHIRDLSPSGIFVQTGAPIDVGMRCALAFPLPGSANKVHVIGRVVRTVAPDATAHASDRHVPGIGIEFERFGGENDRRAIESYLHRHEAETRRPERSVYSV